MTVKTNGAEINEFFADKKFWPENAYHDDEEMTVDGQPWTWDCDIKTVAPSAAISISGGIVYLSERDKVGPSLEAYFRMWRKQQQTVTFICEAPKEKAAAVLAAIKAAGGKTRVS